MFHVFLSTMLLLNLQEEIEKKILFIKSNVRSSYKSEISDILSVYYAKGLLTKQDIDIIISMAFVESSYENIVGTHGEIGMMQVIPKDGHIQEIYCNILNIRVCNVTAKELNEILKKNTKLAFRVGVEEYLYWKEQYRNKYKKMYWEKYPKWLLVDKDELFIKNHKKKWETIKKILGDFVFIAHYNWGGRFLFSDSAWAYLFKVSNVFLEFNNYFVDGEKE